MLNPKWATIAVALGVFALAAGYDAQLGLAVGIVIVVIAALYLWVQLRFAIEPGESPADRSKLAQRFATLGRNRRAAQAARAQAEAEAKTPPSE